MRFHGLKMNLVKYAFGVSTRNSFGFLVPQKRIEFDKNKAKVVLEVGPPQNKKELHNLFGKINFLHRFIANSAHKMKDLSPLLKVKDKEEFIWGDEQRQTFEQI